MYTCVVKVIGRGEGVRIVNLSCKGKALEYAVKMLEIPQEHRMDNLLRAGKVNSDTIRSLTRKLTKFHGNAKTNARITNFGSHEFMASKIKENFLTLSKLKSGEIYAQRLMHFVKNNESLFFLRMKQGRIREIHGDLYLRNIFLSKKKFYLYDRIEFNTPLRYADVAEDLAHLSMDLDFYQREDLRKLVVSDYKKQTGDTIMIDLIYFMMCYKSCVRS